MPRPPTRRGRHRPRPSPAEPGPGLTAAGGAAAARDRTARTSVPAPRRRGVAWRRGAAAVATRCCCCCSPPRRSRRGRATPPTRPSIARGRRPQHRGGGRPGAAGRARRRRAAADWRHPQARVRARRSCDLLVAAADVVPGDLLVLEAGDVVRRRRRSASRRTSCEADDSALTGESLARRQATTADELFAGTTVTRGRGRRHRDRAPAPTSTLGRIAALVASARPGPTPLQRRLTRLGRQLTVAAVALSALVVVRRPAARPRPGRTLLLHGRQPGGGRRPGVAPGRADAVAGAGRPPDGPARGDRSRAARGRDTRAR